MDNIQEQIRALQTSVRRQRFVTVAAIGMCVSAWLFAAAPQQSPYMINPNADVLKWFEELNRRQQEQQQQWIALKRQIESVLSDGANAKFGTVTCRRMILVDQSDRPRIDATWMENGDAGIQFIDKGGVRRILAATYANGDAGVQWFDKSGKKRIDASTAASGAVVFPVKADK